MKNPRFLHGIDIQEFLENTWQQQPKLLPASMNLGDWVPSAEELAGLSLEEDVESRMIELSESGVVSLEHGPFDEEKFSEFSKGYTLLVQDVDKLLPRVSQIAKEFFFVPNWRFDDVMISYSEDGGGVGPHFDQYDVFLIQVEGQKRWEIGEKCSEDSPLRAGSDLAILENFQKTQEWVLNPGDILYLPPGIPHNGTSLGKGMTVSIGFRSPGVGDFLQALSSEFKVSQRFTDCKRPVCSNPYKIESWDRSKFASMLTQIAADDDLIAQVLGKMVTVPKYDEEASDVTLEAFWKGKPLYKQAFVRMAYSLLDREGKEILRFCINGSEFEMSVQDEDWVIYLCESDVLKVQALGSSTFEKSKQVFLEELLQKGFYGYEE